MPPMNTKSRIIESFGLKSGGAGKSEYSAGGIARGKGKRYHRKRAKEMIKAMKNEQKEKEKQGRSASPVE